jgi:FtsP/CotA-like multicopper oxidase with cupredoxin domain
MRDRRLTRRELLRLWAVAGLGLALPGIDSRRPAAATAGTLVPQAAPYAPRAWLPWMGLQSTVAPTPLPGGAIPRFVDPLPVFGPASGGSAPRVTGSSFTMAVREFQQQVLPATVYAQAPDPASRGGTWVWGYQINTRPAHYPGYTIEAQHGIPTTVMHLNELPTSPRLWQYLTVDQTIHWADPLGHMGDRSPYAGPPPVVPHLHGGVVPSASDGLPDAWFTPGVTGQRLTGRGFISNVYHYPNSQPATTLWLHDHALGLTRLNVYAGLSVFYLLRDQYDTGVPGTGLNLPAGAHEIELMIQDRQFDANGQWLFPASFPGGLQGPPPNPTIHPYWIPMFLGDAMIVNGKTWPYLEVEPRRYRFRVVNGCNARFVDLQLVDRATAAPGPAIWQIGSDGGLLDQPVQLSAATTPAPTGLLLAPAERADIIVDFAGHAGQTLRLANSAAAPYAGGSTPDPATTGQVMEFRVGHTVSGGSDTSYNPAAGAPLRGGAGRPPAIVRLESEPLAIKRQLTLIDLKSASGSYKLLLNNTRWDGMNPTTQQPVTGSRPDGLDNWVTELPVIGSTELWEIINLSDDAHPVHLHLVQFQLLNRQAALVFPYYTAWAARFGLPGGSSIPEAGPPMRFTVPNADGAYGGNPAFAPYLSGSPIPPEPGEQGWKDTVKVYPGQVTRLLVRWASQDVPAGAVSPGQNTYPFDPTAGHGYVWHCHILDHEDNEMMRPVLLLS